MAAPAAVPGEPFRPEEILLEGRAYLLRPLEPADAPRLQDFFLSHTLDTIHLRYGHAVARMTPERAHDLVSVDQTRDLAIAVFEVTAEQQVIHAVGRYYVDPDGRAAEIAFVVRETLRRRGLGARLMRAMIDVARRRGLEALWGRVLRENVPMLELFRRFGGAPVARPDTGDTDVEMRIPLRAPTPPEKIPRARKRRPAPPPAPRKVARKRDVG